MIGKLAWAVVSAALALGLNHQLRPNFEAAYERTESAEVVGKLSLGRDGPVELPSRAAHVVVATQHHFGRTFAVRELSVRGGSSSEVVPSFELFAELPASLPAQAAPSVLRGVELPVREYGRLGARRSFLRRTAAGPQHVVTGSLVFTDVRVGPRSQGGSPRYFGEARLELQVESERGVELLTGKWSGPIKWH